MSDPLREALERIIAVSDREPRCVNTRDAEEMEAIAREALAIEPEYQYRAMRKGSHGFDRFAAEEDAAARVDLWQSLWPDADSFVERRIKAGEWERLP